MKLFKNMNLYSRLALTTSVTLVVGYFVVYAVYTNIDSAEVAPSATITSTLMGKIKTNFDDLSTRVTTLEGAIAGASVWSKVGSDINYTAGKVGIGTVTPPTKLSLYDGATGPIASFQGITANYRGIKIADTANSENWFAGANDTNKFVIRRAGTTDDVTVDTSGNVGIGTASPGYKLDVTNSVGSTYGLSISNTGDNLRLLLGDTTGGLMNIQGKIINSGAPYNITLQSEGGKVGIGTTSPSDTLTVNGGVTANTFTSPVTWSAIAPTAGWTSAAYCRRIGSFLQIKGYVYYSTGNVIPTWGVQVATLPVECRPSANVAYPVGNCWNFGGTTTFACFSMIGTAGDIGLYTSNTSSMSYFSPAGTYPAN